jgi:hypothetical protein
MQIIVVCLEINIKSHPPPTSPPLARTHTHCIVVSRITWKASLKNFPFLLHSFEPLPSTTIALFIDNVKCPAPFF